MGCRHHPWAASYSSARRRFARLFEKLGGSRGCSGAAAHLERSNCPLSEVDLTWQTPTVISGSDPERTLAVCSGAFIAENSWWRPKRQRVVSSTKEVESATRLITRGTLFQ
jgi:hypothetical protein